MRLLRRYGWWVGLALIVCVAGAALIGVSQARRYATTAQVDVEARVLTGTVPVTPNLTTEKAVATSGRVLAGVARQFGLTTAAISARVSVTIPVSTNLLSVTCVMPTAGEARGCADGAAFAYMRFRDESTSPAAVRATDPIIVTLVTSAPLPGAPVQPRLPELLLIGALLGLVLGVGTAYVRDRSDDRVRGADDLARCLGAPVPAAIPAAPRGSDPAAIFRTAPLSAMAEACRRLRVHLDPLLARRGDLGKVALVTGAQPGEGRTCVASNLAVALSRAGARVLLVDADLRGRSLSQELGASAKPGLTDLLGSRRQLREVAVATGQAGLRLVPAGANFGRPADLLEISRLTHLFGELRTAADVVVVDTGPVLSLSDPVAFARVSDVVIMVANTRVTRRAAVTAAAAEIRTASGGILIGVVTRLPGRWARLARMVLGWVRPGARGDQVAPGEATPAQPALGSGHSARHEQAQPSAAATAAPAATTTSAAPGLGLGRVAATASRTAPAAGPFTQPYGGQREVPAPARDLASGAGVAAHGVPADPAPTGLSSASPREALGTGPLTDPRLPDPRPLAEPAPSLASPGELAPASAVAGYGDLAGPGDLASPGVLANGGDMPSSRELPAAAELPGSGGLPGAAEPLGSSGPVSPGGPSGASERPASGGSVSRGGLAARLGVRRHAARAPSRAPASVTQAAATAHRGAAPSLAPAAPAPVPATGASTAEDIDAGSRSGGHARDTRWVWVDQMSRWAPVSAPRGDSSHVLAPDQPELAEHSD